MQIFTAETLKYGLILSGAGRGGKKTRQDGHEIIMDYFKGQSDEIGMG